MSRIYAAMKRAGRERGLPAAAAPVAVSQAREALSWPSQEAYQRLLRAVLQRMQPAGGGSILVTSAVHGEGTSTVARNLARGLSRAENRRVLLVDANLRTPAQHAAFGVPRSRGLCDALIDPGDLERAWSHSFDPGLTLITCGRPTDNPAQVLSAPRLRGAMERLRSRFEWLVLDGPPATLYSEVTVLAELTDATILVVRADKTRWEVAAQAKRILEQSGGRVLGGVLNRRRYYIPNWIYRRL